jgi:hypothetical protein
MCTKFFLLPNMLEGKTKSFLYENDVAASGRQTASSAVDAVRVELSQRKRKRVGRLGAQL